MASRGRAIARGALVGITAPLWLPFKLIPPLGRLLHALDQAGNAVLPGGDVDETISSRLGKSKLRNGGRIPWRVGLGIPRMLDELLETVDPGHSLDAIEGDEGERVHLPPGHPHAPPTPHVHTTGRCFHCGESLTVGTTFAARAGLTWCGEHATVWLHCQTCRKATQRQAPRGER